MARRVIVVEADDIENRGTVAALRDAGQTALGLHPDPDEGWLTTAWEPGDVVLVGVGDPGAWDHLAILGPLGRLAAAEPALRIVGLLRRPTNPVATLRMQRAGLSEAHLAAAYRTGADLVALARHPCPEAAPRSDPVALEALGVGPKCDPEGVVAYVTDRHLEPAMVRGLSQRSTGLTRRTIERVRRDLTSRADLTPAMERTPGGQHRDLSLPPWRQVVGFVDDARGGSRV